mgnify:CR=1 FL=1
MNLKRNFTHLNVSSAYSLRYASGMPEKIVEQAKLLNFSKIAITDQDTLSGAINFVQHCLANSITPIIGVDFNLGKSRVLVLARGKNGDRGTLECLRGTEAICFLESRSQRIQHSRHGRCHRSSRGRESQRLDG